MKLGTKSCRIGRMDERIHEHRALPILHRMLLILVGCALLNVIWAVPQSAQSQRPEPSARRLPTYRVASNLVVVDITVRDKKGNLIADLRKEDFVIFEDDVPQEIVTFSLEKVPVAPPVILAEKETEAAKAAEVTKPPVVNLGLASRSERMQADLQDKRLIVLFFDLSSLSTEDLIRSVETAQDFVTRKSSPHDLLAIVIYSSTLELVQDLTNDREVVMKTLKSLNPTEAGDTPEEDLGDVPTSEDEYVPDDVQFNIFNTDRRLSALETLAKAYREFPERKSLIYFSSGVTTTGIENQSQIRSTVDAANQSNMSIYTVDSRGLVALPPGGGASRGSPRGRALFSGQAVWQQTVNLSNSQETLTTLAYDTGGTSFQDTNDLAPVFDKVLSDTQTYYVLGYYSKNTKEDGKFRKIRVEVRRPDLKLQHRPGYFALKQFTRLTQVERDRQLEEALLVDRPFSELPFILEADYFKRDGKISLVPVTIQLAGDAVHFEQKKDRREAQFEFLAQIKDPQGRVAGVARDTVQVRLPVQTAEKIRTGQILYTTRFQLRPGEYNLKFLVRDNRTGKLGSFEQPLAVPALDGTALQVSSIVVGNRLVDAKEDSRGVEHQGFGERFRMLGTTSDPLIIGEKRIVPSIGNVFLSRQTLYVYFQVYGAGEDSQTKKPSLETTLLFLEGNKKLRESQPHRIETWEKDQKDVATVAVAVPLRGLNKGTYTVQIHLRDELSQANLFRRVPLVIE